MSFSFGAGSTSGFGSSSGKPTGFGTPLTFGAATTTTATTSSGFGSFGTTSTFGATPQPSFGSAFGTPASAPAPAFGTSFGQPTATVAPTFGTGSGFGATAASTAAPAFGSTFGAASTGTGLFGATSKPGGLFGAAGTTTAGQSFFSTPTATSGGLFGSGTQTSGLFGTATTCTPSFFGTTTSTSAPLFGSTFGTTTTSSAPSLFGGTTPSLGLGSSLFGATPATTQSLFSGFGTTTATTAGSAFGGTFGGFGTTATAGSSLFGSLAPKPAAPAVPSLETLAQQVLASFYAINVFADERDDVLKKWNMLQACWGVGKGYYNPNQPPIEYNHKNPFYRFKSVGYRLIPTRDNSEGMVLLMFNKKASDISNQKDVLVNGLMGILGNKPNLSVAVENVKALTDTTCEVTISVTEKGVTGSSRKIPANELSTFLNQPTQKQQLTNAGVFIISAFATPSQEQINEYLNNPPPEVDLALWKAAQEDNPDPKRYLPCQINGFADLKKRLGCQENQAALQSKFIDQTIKELQDLKKKNAASVAQIAELRQKFLQLQHRLLRILVKQESTRKVGLTLQPEEERLRERFEAMRCVVESPNHFRGQIRDLLANMRYVSVSCRPTSEIYKIDAKAQEDLKQFLKMQQQGIAELVKIVNDDLKDLKIIHDGLNQVIQLKH